MIELIGGRDALDLMLDAYNKTWQNFVANNNLQAFAQIALPTTISWKVEDRKSLFNNLEQLAEHSEQVHIGMVDHRFIASIVLIEPYQGMRLIKILERRADSNDPLGLDSIDYLVEKLSSTYELLGRATDCSLQKQHNDHHSWLSLRFGETREFEAKFTDHLVLDIAQKQLASSEQEILSSLGIS
jgi:hypothetical protein